MLVLALEEHAEWLKVMSLPDERMASVPQAAELESCDRVSCAFRGEKSIGLPGPPASSEATALFRSRDRNRKKNERELYQRPATRSTYYTREKSSGGIFGKGRDGSCSSFRQNLQESGWGWLETAPLPLTALAPLFLPRSVWRGYPRCSQGGSILRPYASGRARRKNTIARHHLPTRRDRLS